MKQTGITKVFEHESGNRIEIFHAQPNHWNYYIFLNDMNSSYTKETPIKTIEYDCDDHGHFHGGVTYCRRFTVQMYDNPDPTQKWQSDGSYYKVGCDYAHLGDEGRYYSEEYVLFDAKRTISKLIENGIMKEVK